MHMIKYTFNITWQTRCRGVISKTIEAKNEVTAREILVDALQIDFNNGLRYDTEWDVDSVVLEEDSTDEI